MPLEVINHSIGDYIIVTPATRGLKGEKGDKGDVGEQGLQGEQGPQGVQGEVGPQGPQGIQGEKGDVGAQGPQGIQGTQGPQGEVGPQGPNGDKGDAGPQGPQGIQGPQGPQGIAGPSDHSALSNLSYATSGHTGFEPAKGIDDNYVTDNEKAGLQNRSQGCVVIPTFTDNNNGSAVIGNATVNLSHSIDGSGIIYQHVLTGGTFTFTDLLQNYIVGDYNNGSPIMKVITDVSLINETTVVPIFSVFRNGNYLHLQNWDLIGSALSNKVHQSIVKTQRYRRESGLSLSETGTRNLSLTSGIIWTGAVKNELTAISTATDNLFLWYHSGGNWSVSVLTQYNNTQYDNGTNLATLTTNRYAVNWVFRGVEQQKHLYVVLGTGDYTLASAQSSVVPSVPPAISSHAILVGKIIVQKSASTAYSIQSAFDIQFGAGGISSHSDLTNLDYASSGHTGFAPALGTDDNYVTDAEKAALHPAVTVSDTSSIDMSLTGQQISASAIFGTTIGTVCQGNDSRLSDARTPTTHTHAQSDVTDLVTGLAGKQATLVSSTNIKTINGSTILGSGDLAVSATIADGDKGDVTVSSSGTVWTVDSSIFLSNTADVLTTDGGLDCNTVTKHWHLGGNGGSNYPVNASGTWYYVETVFYTTTRCRQIAYGYTDNRVYTRQLYGGAWSSWVPIMTANDIGLKNQSTSSQTGFSSDTYLTGSFITFPYAPKVGTTYKLTFDVTKTNVGTATPIITIRTGTAGTTSDTARCTFTFGSGTTAADTGIFEVICTFRTVGGTTTAVLQGISKLTNNLTTTGLSNAVKSKVSTSSGFDSTTASLGIGASYNGGSSAAHTIQLVRAELIM